MKFETERLSIRPFELKDIDDFMLYRNDLLWMQYQGYKGLSKKRYINDLIGDQNIKDGMQLAVCLKDSDLLIGDLYIKKEKGVFWIGYTISPTYSHRGYTREAVSGLIATVNEIYGDVAIKASTLDENKASNRLLLSLGFKFLNQKNKENFYEKRMNP